MKSVPSILATSLLAAGMGLAFGAAAQTTPPRPAPTQNVPQPMTPPASTSGMQPPSGTHPAFNQLDANQDGKLERSEVPASMNELHMHFQQYDQDHDGSLSASEYAAYNARNAGRSGMPRHR